MHIVKPDYKGITISWGAPWPSSQHKDDAFATEVQRAENKTQWQEIKNKREGGGSKRKGEGIFIMEGNIELPLDREETDIPIGKRWFIKGEGKPDVVGWIWMVPVKRLFSPAYLP